MLSFRIKYATQFYCEAEFVLPLNSASPTYFTIFNNQDAILAGMQLKSIKGKISTLEISNRIGLGKDRLMTYLYELKNEGKINYEVKGRTYIWYLE